jgi:hypothetical protein
MKKYGEIAADLAVIHPQQIFARAADHDPVALLDREAQQGVSNCSTDQIHLHE